MKTHSNILVAGAAMLALTAAAATVAVASSASDRHEITLRLPGGGIEHIEYTGEAPKVVFSQAPLAWPRVTPIDFWAPPSFVNLERLSADMDRQIDALFKDDLASFVSVPKFDNGTLANLPPGTISTTWSSTSFGNGFCTRVTQITKVGTESKPQIVSRETGDCGPKSAATPGLDSRSKAHDGGLTETGLKVRKTESASTTL